ncbi:MAG: efflux RND transporter periplasmic adaptor subunit [Gammaproteobacteria bacterium]|jgi:membrane fusion protein (multidrug efflux system)
MMMIKYLKLLLLTITLVACQQQQQAPSPTVATAKAQLSTVVKTASYAGTVTTVEMIELLPRISGYLQERVFEQGQLVKKGDLLFVIEPDQYQAAVLQKQADLAAAEATLTERTLNVERFRTLYEKRVVAKANLDQAESDFSNAKANVDAAKAALTNAELDLSYTKIYAPITGRIGVTQFSPGDYLSTNTSTLTTIVQLDPIRVVFSIPEKEWLAIETKYNRSEQNINDYLTPRIQLSDGAMYQGKGFFAFVDNHIDSSTGALAVYATFENPNAILLPGQFVNVIIEQGQAKQALMVPSAAVLFDKKGHYMLLVNQDSVVEQRYVKTGIVQDDKTEILEGITADDVFIVDGLQKVAPGIKVNVKQNTASASLRTEGEAIQVAIAKQNSEPGLPRYVRNDEGSL